MFGPSALVEGDTSFPPSPEGVDYLDSGQQADNDVRQFLVVILACASAADQRFHTYAE